MADPIEKQIARLRERHINLTIGRMDRATQAMASPIEQALWWAFVCEANAVEAVGESEFVDWLPTPRLLPGATRFTRHSLRLEVVLSHTSTVEVFPQQEVRIGDRNYRLDFAIWARGLNPKWSHGSDLPGWVGVPIAVECDGHDFHERTKEQAKRDKERDRALQSAGWAVARFTGAEIFADPIDVARSVFAFADQLLDIKGKA